MALASACAVLGCGKSDPGGAAGDQVDYTKDKVLMRELTSCKEKRDGLLTQRYKLSEELAAEQAKDPNSDRVKELRQRIEACDAEFEKNQAAAYAAVRSRILKKGGEKK